MGEPAFKRALLRYYDTWKFKHPNANDFIRIMEKESGLELDWYKEYFVYTTHTIDYAIDSLGTDQIYLSRKGVMPMPVDVLVTYENGSKELFTIPLCLMRGTKKEVLKDIKFTVAPRWYWTNPTYMLKTNGKIMNAQIDPFRGMADSDVSNNKVSK